MTVLSRVSPLDYFQVYNFGVIYFLISSGHIIAIPVTVFLITPVFYNLKLTSAYQVRETQRERERERKETETHRERRERHTDRDRQGESGRGGTRERHTDRYRDRQTEGARDVQRERDRQTDRQTDGQRREGNR